MTAVDDAMVGGVCVEEVGYGVADGIQGRAADSRPPRKRFESFNRAAKTAESFLASQRSW